MGQATHGDAEADDPSSESVAECNSLGGDDMEARLTLAPLALLYLKGRRVRGEIEPATARDQRTYLLSLAASFGGRPVNQYGRRAVERWLEDIGHLAPATRALRLGVVRGFSEWLLTEGYVAKLATAGIKAPRRKRRVTRDVGRAEYERLLAQATQARTRLIIALMYGLGLRCVEVSRLLLDDWDPVDRTIIVAGKRRDERSIPVPEQLARVLDGYIASERITGGPLIRSLVDPSKGVGAHCVSDLVRRVFIDSGVKVRTFDGRSAHALRAAAASDLVDVTGDPRLAQQLLGHASLATTSVYMRRLGQRQLRDALERRAMGQETPLTGTGAGG